MPMHKDILIATHNLDKFRIVKNMLKTLGIPETSIRDLRSVSIEEEYLEYGSATKRAKDKAIFYAQLIEKKGVQNISVVLGIDDELFLPASNQKITNIKDSLTDFILGNVIETGEIIHLHRYFAFLVTQSQQVLECETKVPFTFMGLGKYQLNEVLATDYPLSFILAYLGQEKVVSELAENEATALDLSFSQLALNDILSLLNLVQKS